MDGPSHYAEAERLLHIAEDTADSPSGDLPYTAQMVGEAQVHATLALAAATAMSNRPKEGFGMDPLDYDAWDRVAGHPGGRPS